MLSKENVANIILQEGHLYGSMLLRLCKKMAILQCAKKLR